MSSEWTHSCHNTIEIATNRTLTAYEVLHGFLSPPVALSLHLWSCTYVKQTDGKVSKLSSRLIFFCGCGQEKEAKVTGTVSYPFSARKSSSLAQEKKIEHKSGAIYRNTRKTRKASEQKKAAQYNATRSQYFCGAVNHLFCAPLAHRFVIIVRYSVHIFAPKCFIVSVVAWLPSISIPSCARVWRAGTFLLWSRRFGFHRNLFRAIFLNRPLLCMG